MYLIMNPGKSKAFPDFFSNHESCFVLHIKINDMLVTNPINSKLTSGSNISVWTNTFPPIYFSPLRENLETDVVVVGGGIAGVSIAYRLSELNRKVILVEDGYIGSGETGRTTAHLVTALDDRYEKLERLFGEEGARLAFESNKAAIDFVERAILKEKIAC